MDAEHLLSEIGRDPDALEAFYRAHLDAVQRFVARRVDSPEDAADLTAEVFMAAIRASRSYRGDAVPLAWLYGIARHTVASHHRSAARGMRAVTLVAGRDMLDDDSTDRILDRIHAERQARHIYRSLEALPQRQRAVVELVAVDALSLTEAAEVLKITPGNARIRYHRARKRLAEELSRPLPDLHEVTP